MYVYVYIFLHLYVYIFACIRMVAKTKNAATQQCAAVQCARIDRAICHPASADSYCQACHFE